MPELRQAPFDLATTAVRSLAAAYGLPAAQSSASTNYGLGRCAEVAVARGWNTLARLDDFLTDLAVALNVPNATRAASLLTRLFRAGPEDFDAARIDREWDTEIPRLCAPAHAAYRSMTQAAFDRSVVFLQAAHWGGLNATGDARIAWLCSRAMAYELAGVSPNPLARYLA